MRSIKEIRDDIEFNEIERDSLTETKLYPEVVNEMVNPPDSVKLPGWANFNELVGGLRMREFTILCGSTGSGKTTLLSSLARALKDANKNIYVLSVETGPRDFLRRTMSAYMGKDLNRGEVVDKEEIRFFTEKYGSHICKDNIYLSKHDNRLDPEHVIDQIVLHKDKYKCDFVFIDNLNFLLEVVSQNRQIEVMDNVTHQFIMLSKQLDVHIVMVMHPRKTEDTRVESEFDIKGSSTAVQEAHNVFLFNRPSSKQLNSFDLRDLITNQHRELIIRKLRRRGESIGKSIWLKYENASYKEVFEYTQFSRKC